MLPEELLNSLQQKKNNQFIFELVAQQIKKDWERSGLWELSVDQLESSLDLVNLLEENLASLVLERPDSLKNLLYIMDLNEIRLRIFGDGDSVEKLTKEILKREYLKVKLRLEIG